MDSATLRKWSRIKGLLTIRHCEYKNYCGLIISHMDEGAAKISPGI